MPLARAKTLSHRLQDAYSYASLLLLKREGRGARVNPPTPNSAKATLSNSARAWKRRQRSPSPTVSITPGILRIRASAAPASRLQTACAVSLRRLGCGQTSRCAISARNWSVELKPPFPRLLLRSRDCSVRCLWPTRRVDASDRESFSINGTAHLLAIAGWHLQFLIFLFWKALGWTGLSRRKSAWLVMLTVCAFCALTGAAVPVVRATVMTVLFFARRRSAAKPTPSAPWPPPHLRFLHSIPPSCSPWDFSFRFSPCSR